MMEMTMVNANPDHIISALAEAYKVNLERKTGRKVTVTIERRKDDSGRAVEPDQEGTRH